MNKIKVSFDFDGTLTIPYIQEFAKFLLQCGVDVYVITSRFDELHKHNCLGTIIGENNDLWEITDKIGIQRHKVRFTLMQPKWEYINGTKICLHLDDDPIEVDDIVHYAKYCTPVLVSDECINRCITEILTEMSYVGLAINSKEYKLIESYYNKENIIN